MISQLRVLLIFDDCDPIVESDPENFMKLIEDICCKVMGSNLVFTSQYCIPDFDKMNGLSLEMSSLTARNIFDIMAKKADSKNALTSQIFALQKETRKGDLDATKKVDFEHPFFKMLNGNPLSALLVASLTRGKFFKTH